MKNFQSMHIDANHVCKAQKQLVETWGLQYAAIIEGINI